MIVLVLFLCFCVIFYRLGVLIENLDGTGRVNVVKCTWGLLQLWYSFFYIVSFSETPLSISQRVSEKGTILEQRVQVVLFVLQLYLFQKHPHVYKKEYKLVLFVLLL